MTLIVVWRLRAQETRSRWRPSGSHPGSHRLHLAGHSPPTTSSSCITRSTSRKAWRSLALTLSPPESLAWIVIFGGLDECFQYAVLSRWSVPPLTISTTSSWTCWAARSASSSAWLFLRCTRRDPSEGPIRLYGNGPGIAAILGILATGILLWASGLMLLFEDKTDTRHWFSLSRFRAHVLVSGPHQRPRQIPHPLAHRGPILILATIALYAASSSAACASRPRIAPYRHGSHTRGRFVARREQAPRAAALS
jgi:hypothetical protein